MKKTPSSKKPAAKSPQTKTLTKNTNDFSELRSLQEIKELIEFVAEKQFDEIELERGDFRLCLRKGGTRTGAEVPLQVALPAPPPVLTVPVAPTSSVPSPAPVAEPAVAAASAAAPVAEDLHIITSPIVGTFYRSSSPTTEPFIKIGDTITAGQTLCIVEAMKLMNEIQSDISGTVAKILVENAQPVEYGQPLFGIKL
ncbi:MAG TPA: acetyl-CoA carboxylase biotin carboxyl carrier protein [Blastocatellia bacterium]|nr:acetyl-CoA carboxylase biotin carboxyl carrier protein [Blastocatellia bacterium]